MSIDSLAGGAYVDDNGRLRKFIELRGSDSAQLDLFETKEFAKYHAGEESKINSENTDSYNHVTLVFVEENWSYKVISRDMWEIMSQREMHYFNECDDGAVDDVTNMLQGFRATSTTFDPMFDSQKSMCVFSGDVSTRIEDCLQHSLHKRFLGDWSSVMACNEVMPERMIN